VALSACGGGSRQDAHEPSGTFPVQIATASFPSSQRLSQHTHLVIAVRNTGNHTIPDVAVTISDPKYGTSVQAFGQYLNQPGLASHTRPVWVVDRAPEPGGCAYSCQSGGLGGAVTAYSNTWALGALRPGQTAKFDWSVTAVSAGKHVIQYEVAAGLNGKAKARMAGGAVPKGKFTVDITRAPQKSFVTGSGQVVPTQ
jgi:hypothetical protein